MSSSNVLYQNRSCHQENVGGFMYKSGYGLNETIHNNQSGLKGFKIFVIEHSKFSKPRKDTSSFLLNSNNSVIVDTEYEDYLKFKKIIPKNSFRFRNLFPDKRTCFCICTFMKELYVFGGRVRYTGYTETCFKFNFSLNKWSYIAQMKIDRSNAACVVFEGKVVVTGGNTAYKEIEAYGHYEDKWTFLENMSVE